MKASLVSECLGVERLTPDIYGIEFRWDGPAPEPGQFFMVRAAAFLGRPLSMARWRDGVVRFLVTPHGPGTQALVRMRAGATALVTGPLGTTWGAAPPRGCP